MNRRSFLKLSLLVAGVVAFRKIGKFAPQISSCNSGLPMSLPGCVAPKIVRVFRAFLPMVRK